MASALDVTKQAAAVTAASGTLAASNQAIAQANTEAAAAPTTQEFLSSLSKAVAVQVVAQGAITTQLAAGTTTGLPTDDRALADLAGEINLNGLSLTATQPATADTTGARITDIAVDRAAASGTLVYRVQLSEGADLTAGTPTLTLAKSGGGTLTLQYNAGLSTSNSLAFSAAAPTDERTPVTPMTAAAYTNPRHASVTRDKRSGVELGATRNTRSRPVRSLAATQSAASSGMRSGVMSPAPPASRSSSAKRSTPRRRTRFQ